MTYISATDGVSYLYKKLQEELYKDLQENSVQLLLNYLSIYKDEICTGGLLTRDESVSLYMIGSVLALCNTDRVEASIKDILRVVRAYEYTYNLKRFTKLGNLIRELQEHCTESLEEIGRACMKSY